MLTVFLTLGVGSGSGPIRNFSPQSAMLERGFESTFLDIPSAEGALDHVRFLNQQSHYPGSEGDYNVAVYMRDRLRAYGFDAELEPFRARIDTPKKLVLQLITSPKQIQGFDLHEGTDPADPDPARPDAGLPFNYGSGDGDVRAFLVYVNRGLEEDYATLAKAGVPVRGRIVLIRYGAEFRGLLAQRAQDQGAAGVIFYSDPKDDGFARGAVYPDGPFRPAGSVQRGSVSKEPLRIPTLPVSSTTATALLWNISGQPAASSWDGALSAPYVYGTSKATVHLQVVMKRSIQTIWNTIGKIAGTDPQQSVVLGAHRDAWVYGITDNGSGVSTVLEAARGLGYLHRSGWRPKRTIILAGWDGEDIGELGSTNYVRVHQNELRGGCVAYINADENVSGPRFGASAAAAIASEITGATRAVEDPQTTQISLFDRWLKNSQTAAHNRYLREPTVSTPGGGSDYEPFLFELGIPIANAGFGGPLGVYHSAYDDLKFATTIADPHFTLHRAMAQVLGIVVMRLADSDTIPYRFSPYVPVLRESAAGLEARAQAMGLRPDIRPLRVAIERFAQHANNYDRRVNAGTDGIAAALSAVHLLDTAVYGANGYASTAFPKVTAAVASGNAAQMAATLADVVRTLDQAASYLR